MSTSKSFLTALFLLSVVFVPINAQDDPHIFWEFNTEPVSNDEYSDEHFWEFPDYDHAEYCVENTDEGYYICAASTRLNQCTNTSWDDLSIIKINYDGEVFDRDYVCDFDVSNPGQSEDVFGIAYYNEYLYIGFNNLTINENNNPGYDLYADGYGKYIGKFTLDGDPVWVNRVEGCEGLCDNNYEFDYMNVDNDGNLILLGTSRIVTTGPTGQTVNTNVTTISKYSADGTLLYVSIHHMGYEYISNNNWEECYPGTYEYPESFTIDDDNNLYFVGSSYCGGLGGAFPYLGKVDLSDGSVIWVKDLSDEMPFTKLNTVSVSSNGNIFIGGQQATYPAVGLLDSNGNPITFKQFVYCYQEPYQSCNGDIYDSSFLPNGDIVVVGSWNFTDAQQFGAMGVLVFLNEEDLEINRLSRYDGEMSNGAGDDIARVILTSDNSLLLAGKLLINDHQHAVVYKVSSKEGCTDVESCNYDEFANYDDGSCWQSVDSCTCSDPEGAVDDICGQCNGNGYDTCDNDEDGTSNFDQWGYGAYDITISDIPDDYGGAVYLSFHGSFHDDGIDEGEFYTIERHDSTGWISLNSISAYGQETYTTEASTQFDGDTTEFRVIASLSEGTFISTASGYGTSVDNNTLTGCMDINACNYNSQATFDDGSCSYPDEYYDCSENCLSDLDFDGLCDELDTCPLDSLNDADGDGVCGDVDLCEGFDDNVDTDMDGIADGCDTCPLDSLNDADGDGVCGDVDLCEGFDDSIDEDGDGVIDGCEVFGCVDTEACNYNELATEDDSTCFYGYIYCIDLDEDGLGDPEYCYTQCDLTDPIDFYVQNNDDLCPDDPDNDLDGDGICGDVDACPLDSLNDIDGDGLCADADTCPFDYDNDLDNDGWCGCTIDSLALCPPDYDWCPDDSLNDANDNGICDSYEVYGCVDLMACNFDSTANVDDGLCEYETCLDCAGELFGEATLDSCGLCAGGNTGIGPHDQCWAIIDDIVDLPNDQGGRVYLYFTPSSLDTDSLTLRNELYSVERLDPIEDGTDSAWVNVLSGPAYGMEEYVFEVTTLVDSNDFQPGITAFRVLASMDEGIWASDIVYGYSTDDIAPLPPTGLVALVVDISIVLTWDNNGVDDFDQYTIYRSTDSEFVVNEDNILNHTNDTTFTDADIVENTIYYYMVSSTDYNGNVSGPSNQAEGTVYVNYTPTIETIDDLATDEDTPIAIDLQVSDVNGDSLTFEINSSDENVIPQLDGLTLNLDLVENWNGSSDITITVSDNEFDVSEMFTLVVNSVNDAPQSFATIGPVTETIITLTAETINNTLVFFWEPSIDVDGDELIYSISGMDQLTGISADSIAAAEYSISYMDLAEMMQENELSVMTGTWMVSAQDEEYEVDSEDSPELTIDASQLSLDLIGLPTVFALHQNYPNPFNPTTTLRYDLPEDAMVSIAIYDLMGRSIRLLVNSNQSAGYRSVQWDATNNLGEPVSAGMYIYTIQSGEFRQTKKMVLLK